MQIRRHGEESVWLELAWYIARSSGWSFEVLGGRRSKEDAATQGAVLRELVAQGK
jgi:hypothetical protein